MRFAVPREYSRKSGPKSCVGVRVPTFSFFHRYISKGFFFFVGGVVGEGGGCPFASVSKVSLWRLLSPSLHASCNATNVFDLGAGADV